MGDAKRPSDNGVSKAVTELLRVPQAPRSRSKSTPRTWRERGAALAELAMVAPLLVVMVFGIIDFGAVFHDHQELRSAVREGARLAAVNNGCPDPSCLTSAAQLIDLENATKDGAQGIPDPINITTKVCFLHGGSGLPLTSVETPVVGTDNVRVTLTYQASSLTGLFGGLLNSITLTAASVFRLEKTPTYDRNC